MVRLFQTAALLVGLSILTLRGVYAESIPLKAEGGTFVVPALINGKIPLDFTLDSGAADVSIPLDVFSTLRRAHTISESDLLPSGTYTLADGSVHQEVRFLLRSLKVGNLELQNIVGSVAPAQGPLLLGQSFLSRLQTWSVENQRGVLLINEGASSVATQPSVPETSAGEAGRSEPSGKLVPPQSTASPGKCWLCRTRPTQLYPDNDIARSTGPLTAVIQGRDFSGTMTLTLPSGEVLSGRYSIGAGATRFSAGGPSRYDVGDFVGAFSAALEATRAQSDPVVADMVGPSGTSAHCDLNKFVRHGNGVCRFSTGAVYRMQY
jgi:hypothetical protein